MPRYRVIEHHEYTLTFEVDAATAEEAEAVANELGADEGEEDEVGRIDTDVELLHD